MVYKELSIPIYPVRGAEQEDTYYITHAALDDEGNIVAGFGQQIEGNPHKLRETTTLSLHDDEVAQVQKFIVAGSRVK